MYSFIYGLTKFLLVGICSKLSISREVLLFEALQELLLLFSYFLVSRFSINFGEVFDLTSRAVWRSGW